MTPQEVEQLAAEIVAGLESGADMASVLAPQIIPFVLIGKAVDKVVPGLAGMITRWVDGNPPTPEELEDFKKKLAVLGDPNNP